MQISAQSKAMALRNQAKEKGLGTFELSSNEYVVVCSTEEGILKVALLESYGLAFFCCNFILFEYHICRILQKLRRWHYDIKHYIKSIKVGMLMEMEAGSI
jgi:hypothetical protein